MGVRRPDAVQPEPTQPVRLHLLAKLRDSQIGDDVFAAHFSEHDGDLGGTGQVFEGDVLGPMLDRGEGDVFSRPTHKGEFRQPALHPCRHQCARPSDGRAMARRDRIKRQIAVRLGHFSVAPDIVRDTDLAVIFPERVARQLDTAKEFRLLPLPFDPPPPVEIKVHTHPRFVSNMGIG
jgi:hypothetical protein